MEKRLVKIEKAFWLPLFILGILVLPFFEIYHVFTNHEMPLQRVHVKLDTFCSHHCCHHCCCHSSFNIERQSNSNHSSHEKHNCSCKCEEHHLHPQLAPVAEEEPENMVYVLSKPDITKEFLSLNRKALDFSTSRNELSYEGLLCLKTIVLTI